MLQKLEYGCVVGATALIGADRIDLLVGHSSFRLTPFLFFALLLVVIRLVRAGVNGEFEVALSPPVRRQIPFVAVFATFCFLLSIATIFGIDPERGLVALIGFLLVSVLGYGISVWILEEPEKGKLIVGAVTLALVFYLIFCIGQGILWNRGVIRTQDEPNSSLEVIFAPVAGLFLIPRFSGFVIDENRAGFMLVMFWALLDKFAPRTRYTSFLRFVIVLFLLFTFSRSAIICWLAYILFSKKFWMRLKTRKAAFVLASLAVVSSLIFVVYRTEINGLMELWQISDMVEERMSSGRGSSTQTHIELIRRGFDAWAATPRTMIAGMGFGSSYKVLGDFWGDSKYGNFHCLYVTILAEGGLLAFFLLMILLGYPFFQREGAASCVAAIAIFNVPLQAHMEPILWLVVALVWSYERKTRKNRIEPHATVGTRELAKLV